MSDNYWEQDDPNSGDTGGRGLRAQLEKALADLKEVRTERDTLRSQVTETKGVEVLAAKGYKPAVARLAIKDGVDVSDEKALDAWLTENGDLFAKSDADQSQGDNESSDGSDQADLPPGYESAYGAMGRIHAASSPSLVNKYAQIDASLKKDATPEEVLAAYRAAGL